MTPENNKTDNVVLNEDTTTPSGDTADLNKDLAPETDEPTLESLSEQYLLVHGKNVPANKKNDIEWIKSKLVPVKATEDTTTPSVGGKVKIKLLTDVFYQGGKLKEGDELTLESEELSKFADSFYKKI